MKRVALVVALAATAALSGCAGPSSEPAGGNPPTQPPVSATTADPALAGGATTPTPDPSTPASEPLPPGPKFYDATQTTGDGYKQTMHLTLYPAIPGRDITALNAAWEAVGGTGTPPCLDAAGISGSTGVTIPTESSVYAVGKLSITNETADFGSGDMMWDFIAPGVAYGAAMGFGYADKTECDGLDSGTLTKPHWTGSVWGAVPIVVAYGDVVTPNHPDGDYDKVAGLPLRLMETGDVQKITITSGSTPLPDGITIVPADSTWLQQAREQQS